MDLTPSWADIIDGTITKRLDYVFTSQPGIILEYDAATRTASVQPCLKLSHEDEEGDRVADLQPPLPSVPVVFFGGGPFETSYPVDGGDLCILVHTHSSIRQHKTGDGTPLDSGDDRKHHIGDAYAIVGNVTFRTGPADTSTPAVTIGLKDRSGEGRVRVESNKIELGTDASDAAVSQKALDFFATAMRSAIIACAASDPLAAPALQALADALGITPLINGWDAGTTIVKVK